MKAYQQPMPFTLGPPPAREWEVGDRVRVRIPGHWIDGKEGVLIWHYPPEAEYAVEIDGAGYYCYGRELIRVEEVAGV